MLKPPKLPLSSGWFSRIKSTALQVYKMLETFISMIVRKKRDKQWYKRIEWIGWPWTAHELGICVCSCTKDDICEAPTSTQWKNTQDPQFFFLFLVSGCACFASIPSPSFLSCFIFSIKNTTGSYKVKVLITEKTARLGWLFSELAASVWLGGKGFHLDDGFPLQNQAADLQAFQIDVQPSHHTWSALTACCIAFCVCDLQ